MKSSIKKRNFHIPLSDETYSALRKAAEETNIPATQIARDALDYWLKEQKKGSVQREIAQYAKSFAKTKFDLDDDLEEAGIQHLLSSGRKK